MPRPILNVEQGEPKCRKKRVDLGAALRKNAREEQFLKQRAVRTTPDVIILDSDDSDDASPVEAMPRALARPASSVPLPRAPSPSVEIVSPPPTGGVRGHPLPKPPSPAVEIVEVSPSASVPRHAVASASGKKAVGDGDRTATVRNKRLMKELKEIQHQQANNPDPVFTAEIVGDNLYEWDVRLRKVDLESKLAADMRRLSIPCIRLRLVFPDNFPFSPPFMRVVEPRIAGGYVVDGGAICMELLTPSGWTSTYTVEGLVIQFAATVVKGNGRIHTKQQAREYSQKRAEATFKSLVKAHGKHSWYTPKQSEG